MIHWKFLKVEPRVFIFLVLKTPANANRITDNGSQEGLFFGFFLGLFQNFGVLFVVFFLLLNWCFFLGVFLNKFKNWYFCWLFFSSYLFKCKFMCYFWVFLHNFLEIGILFFIGVFLGDFLGCFFFSLPHYSEIMFRCLTESNFVKGYSKKIFCWGSGGWLLQSCNFNFWSILKFYFKFIFNCLT